MTDLLTYSDADTECRGQIALPAGDAAAPGIVIFPDINGVGAHPQGWADRIAHELGYVALVADVYGEGRVPSGFPEGMAWITAFRADPASLVTRAAAAVTTLAAHDRCDGRIATIGFCFGGVTLLELARSGDARMLAGVSLHGALQTSTPARPGAVHAKLLVCHGAEDPMVDYAALTTFLGEMRDAGADCQTLTFTGVVHGFTRPDQDGSNPALKFNAAANTRSWRAMVAHLDEVFG